MALRFTVEYADPNGAYSLADDAAWQRFSSSDSAEEALLDVTEAGRRQHRGFMARTYPPYAVRILDGGDIVIVDVPGSIGENDDR